MGSCLHDLVGRQAALTPDAVAVAFEGTELTYRELDSRANQLAAHLIRLGARPGRLVAVHLRRSPDLLVALLGVLRSGAGYVPIDAQTPWRRLAFIVAEVAPPVVLTEQRLAGHLDGLAVPLLRLDADRALLDALPGDRPAPRAGADDPAYVMYTSGTTGVPNGVVVPHRALANYLTWCVDAYDLRSGSGALVHTSIAFDLTVTTLLAPLVVGQRVILLPDAAGVGGLVDALRTGTDRTVVKLTPTHLKLLSLLLTPAELAGRVRCLVVGGEDLRAESLELFRGAGGPGRIVNEYGPTETVVGSCAYQVTPADPSAGRVPIGWPIAGTAIDVVDARLRPVPDGTPGEAVIRGAGVTDGYLHRPELTARRFLPAGTGDQAGRPGAGYGAYRSGDLVRRRPDGCLEFLGRLDDQVKIRGVRVELGEIEGVLRRHPGVAAVAVTLRGAEPSSPLDDARPVAHVVAAPGAAPDPAELAEHCLAWLPGTHQPEAFYLIDELPTTPNGKLDRSALSDHAAARA